ncbi:protein phosphatase 2C domain-containing protein [Paenibacillus methanolicus]|uniref:Serine/threonine protein phosphatase PrpC n=1 Tax=Paenibacillus methanolicus TaxID=582686 RepID=A0A5S5CH22_9BACL|nr:protein phosphatase 2C domain-containing protein [Paenibacillus methanolicus]TYP79089.1 serine/threonine protein phosphatase PrpC [Paenibacillus methanolicus]
MSEKPRLRTLSWTGVVNPFLDAPSVDSHDGITIGRYGGRRDWQAVKNEDGLLLWTNEEEDWEFAALLDAHATCDSASLIIRTLSAHLEHLTAIIARPIAEAVPRLEEAIMELFASEGFRSACRNLVGETSCLLCLRKANIVWWFSVGDCMLFLGHGELARWGQTMLNQRNFYEWIGRVNTFDRNVPCYSSGRRELRTGRNAILLITDGFLEKEDGLDRLNDLLTGRASARDFLDGLHHAGTKDSTSFIAWSVHNPAEAAYPSD